MKRFALHPGEIVSPNDEDRHYIGFPALCRLYGVRPDEAVDMSRPQRGQRTDNLLHLYASPNGGAYWHVSELERAQYPTDVARDVRKAIG